MLEHMNALTLRADGRELRQRGTAQFPCSVYYTVLSRYAGWEIPWHWHDELEIKLMFQGTALAACGEETILLRETDLPVTEIAFRAGFHSPSYFGKRFRDQMGCSPQAFRQREQA